jgi:predicted RNase H-like nuclease (RuvC/YqgF family)
MFSRHRWAKEMMNRDEEYNRLHDHCQALGRERDGLQREVERLTDELYLAHEALRRQMP